MMIDTQILSYAYKGQSTADLSASVGGAAISSVVAHEFLETYLPASTTAARYYIRYHKGHPYPMQQPERPPSTTRPPMIDKLIFEFGGDFPSIVEYGSRAMAAIVNDRAHAAFAGILDSLDKPFRKKIRPRFGFICREIDECVPLSAETARIGLHLFDQFTRRHSVKGNVRNSVSDMMILATAVSCRARLLSKDSLLNRFAAEVYGVSWQEAGQRRIAIDFQRLDATPVQRRTESKGYINRGWRIADDLRRTPV